jgi:hypothetical protein
MSASGLAASLARIGQVQSHLPTAVSLLLALVSVAALAPGAWLVTRHITVMAHEGAHATMGSAIGHRIDGMEFKLNANGATYTTGPGGKLSIFSITFVGYLGPSAFGIGAAELIKSGHIVAVLWAGLASLLAIILVMRRSFGVITVILAIVTLFGIAGFATVSVQVMTAYFIAWFLLVSSIRIIIIRGKDADDAGKLSGMTKIPAGFWSRVWLVGSWGALVFGMTLLL